MLVGTRHAFRHLSGVFGAVLRKYAVLRAAEDESFVSYEQASIIAHLAAFGQALGAGRPQAAIVPYEFAGGHFDSARRRAGLSGNVAVGGLRCGIPGRKLISDDRAERIGLIIHASGSGLNAH